MLFLDQQVQRIEWMKQLPHNDSFQGRHCKKKNLTDLFAVHPSLFMEVLRWVQQTITKLKRKSCWYRFTKIFMLGLQFVMVMLLLFCGAVVLARLEDPDMFLDNNKQQQHQSTNTILDTTDSSVHKSTFHNNVLYNKTTFWVRLEAKYNLTPLGISRQQFLQDLIKFEELGKVCDEKPEAYHSHHKHAEHMNVRDKRFIFMKWFYFVIIATTTIGYGHVHPKTNNGKLFYIIFSVIGIVLMMTLLRSCGAMIMAINKKINKLIQRRCSGRKEYVSDQLASVISMCLMFLTFMVLVVWHDKNVNEIKKWSWIDTFYFWLVTFTTVGFGDIHFPLEVEIDHFYELVLFRVFGLSFLAGIIESIHVYIKYRKSVIIMKHNRKRLLRKITGQKKSREM